MYIPRISCPTADTLRKKSVLLLGPRRTGKSHYISHELKPDRVYNLLLNRDFTRLSANPGLIREEMADRDRLIVIDEIQKLPGLMDEIHSLIETTTCRFLLTGSSARKLRRTYTSLMAGRARVNHLRPFTSHELVRHDRTLFDLRKILVHGTLPPVLLSDDPKGELEDYTGTYLREEIQAEALSRKIENFSRFLNVAALANTKVVNFTEIGNDAQVPPRTIIEYFQVLEDTLVGTMLPPIERLGSRKAYSKAKFYFFDIGVAHSLAGIHEVPPGTPHYGDAFEHLVYLELKAYRDYLGKTAPFGFWRTHDGAEVDFVAGGEIGIEVKATSAVQNSHLKGLRSLSKHLRLKRKIVVSQDPRRRRIDDIEVLPIAEFLENLWSGQLF